MNLLLLGLTTIVFLMSVGLIFNLARSLIEATYRGKFKRKVLVEEFIGGIPTTLIIVGTLALLVTAFGVFVYLISVIEKM